LRVGIPLVRAGPAGFGGSGKEVKFMKIKSKIRGGMRACV